MCDELACRSTGCSESTGKFVAQNNSGTMVMPTELPTTHHPPRTNEKVQGNLLRDYERKFTNLPDHLQFIKLCSNAGITKTVAKREREYFTTLDDAELENWEVRVESTLYLETTQRGVSRIEEDAASKVKGWIRGHMKICPFLEVAVSDHQGRYGHEIMINSSFGDGTCSWVMVVNGINKYVTEMTEEIQENHIDDIGDTDDFFSTGYVTISPP